MPRLSSRKEEILPSLLDRVSDDGHLLNKLADSKKRVEALEKKLSKNEATVSDETKKNWLAELKSQRGQLVYLQQSSGSLNKIADCVKRDLSWLFNAHNISAVRILEQEMQLKSNPEIRTEDEMLKKFYPDAKTSHDLLKNYYPEVESSVINYGMPDLTGRTASSINIYQLEKNIKDVILRFEPRIIPKTLEIKLHKDKTMMDHNALAFEIKGDLWTDSVPIHMHLLTQLDLENGNVEVDDI